jgi:outer membrane immunogenic protein
MKLSRIFLAGASLVAMASSAYAADLIIEEAPAPIIATAYDWTGLYVGVFAGAGTGTVDYTVVDGDTIDIDDDFDVDGWFGGLTAGANFQTGTFVLGIEGDIAWADHSGTTDITLTAGDSELSFDTDYLGTIRARAGMAFDTVLLYATGGFAFAGGSVHITDIDGTEDASEDTNYTGWALGVGAEMALTENVSVKGEYLYTSLSSDDVDFSADDYDIPSDITVDGDLHAHTFKIGLNYSF